MSRTFRGLSSRALLGAEVSEEDLPSAGWGPGWMSYLAALLRLRSEIGLSYLRKSPVYWSLRGYELAQHMVLGAGFRQMFAAVAELIPQGASVTDLCCGSCKLYTDFLKPKGCTYVGMDFNNHFVRRLRKRGIDARFIELPEGAVVGADFVVMCSSFYHFRNSETELLQRLRSAAGTAVIISEPVRNLSHHSFGLFARLANRLTDPGVGEFEFRHDLESFRSFATENGATDFSYEPGQPGAIAMFAPRPLGGPPEEVG